MTDQTKRIVVISSAVQIKPTMGLDVSEVDVIDPETLQPDWLSGQYIRSKSVGCVIDGFDITRKLFRMVVEIPETFTGNCGPRNLMHLKDYRSEARNDRAIQLLLLAAFFSRTGRPCLIVLNRNSICQLENAKEITRSLATLRSFRYRFVIVDDRTDGINLAVSLINSLQCVGANRFPVGSTESISPMECPNAEFLLRQWEMEEFEHDDVLDSVRESLNYQQQFQHVFLWAATLVRLMATRSFEHHECSARILLTTPDKLPHLTNAHKLRPPYKFNSSPATWFHRADPWLLESGIETALSETSILAVERETGRVLGVYETPPGNPTRFESLCSLTKNEYGQFIIAALKSGYVEVYHKARLLLWYDRYRWRSEPFQALTSKLANIGITDVKNQQTLLGAISTLMDQKESSILVFAIEGDAEKLNSNLKEMRREIQFRSPSGANEPTSLRAKLLTSSLKDLTSLSLASILRLDGAHVICNSTITHVAELISDCHCAFKTGQACAG